MRLTFEEWGKQTFGYKVNRSSLWGQAWLACEAALESERNLIQQVALRAAADIKFTISQREPTAAYSPSGNNQNRDLVEVKKETMLPLEAKTAILALGSQNLVAAHDAQVAAKARLKEAMLWTDPRNDDNPRWASERLKELISAAESSAPKEKPNAE